MTSIGMLPDDILLAIFYFCADEDPFTKKEMEAWQTLVARVSSMAEPCFWITMQPRSTTRLYTGNACEGHAGCLAGLATDYSERRPSRKRG